MSEVPHHDLFVIASLSESVDVEEDKVKQLGELQKEQGRS